MVVQPWGGHVRVLVGALVLASLGSMFGGAWVARERVAFVARSEEVRGVVESLSSSWDDSCSLGTSRWSGPQRGCYRYTAQVGFDHGGAHYVVGQLAGESPSPDWILSASLRQGQFVQLLVDPQDPYAAMPATGYRLFLFPALLFFGPPLFWAGLMAEILFGQRRPDPA